jgi:hypothetical protein
LMQFAPHQNSSVDLLRSSNTFCRRDCSTISRITVYHGRNDRPTTAHPLAEHLDVCIVAQSGAGDAEMDASEADRAQEQGQHRWFTVPFLLYLSLSAAYIMQRFYRFVTSASTAGELGARHRSQICRGLEQRFARPHAMAEKHRVENVERCQLQRLQVQPCRAAYARFPGAIHYR